jgi:hypothetical protein
LGAEPYRRLNQLLSPLGVTEIDLLGAFLSVSASEIRVVGDSAVKGVRGRLMFALCAVNERIRVMRQGESLDRYSTLR